MGGRREAGNMEAGMAKLTANVSFDTDRAIKDPLFWLSLLLDRASFGLFKLGRWKRYVTVDVGKAPDAIEWELHASDGKVMKLADVVLERSVVDVPDCDDPHAPVRREYDGPMMVKAVVVSEVD